MMKWKTNKTQPVIKDSQNTIAIMDITGRINYNLKLEGRGKMTKIAGKKWDDIKEDVIFWQYSDVIETSLKKNLHFQNFTNDITKQKPLFDFGDY